MRSGFVVVTVAVCLIAGCKQPEKSSALVQQVEKAGAGDLSNTSEGAMEQWLAGHKEVAQQIQPGCGTAAKDAPAAWRDSTEGKLCSADAKVMFFVPKDIYKAY